MHRIIHIEDDEDTLNAVNLLLSNKGYRVTSVTTGNQGLKQISENRFDLAIVDIMLPDMSGWDFFQRMKDTCPDLKVVFLSIVPISEERFRCLHKEHISDYILKPFENKNLIKRIKVALTN